MMKIIACTLISFFFPFILVAQTKTFKGNEKDYFLNTTIYQLKRLLFREG